MIKSRKKIIFAIIIVLFIIAACLGWNLYTKAESDSKKENNSVANEEIMGFIEHGAVFPNVSDDDELLPFEYNGGQFDLDYYLNTNGAAEDIGLMVFIDGKIVAFKIKEEDSFKYFNYININGNEGNFKFTLSFVPPDLKVGKIYSFDIISIYYPSYAPDMGVSKSYGVYHSALSCSYSLKYCCETDTDNVVQDDCYSIDSFKYYYEPISDKSVSDFGGSVENEMDLQQGLYCTSYVDGQITYDNYKIEKNKVHITLKITGKPGVEYETTFFLNHKPLILNPPVSVHSVTKEEQICVIDLYLDAMLVNSGSTFYSITMPKNSLESLNYGIGPYKTPSIYLYR